MRTHSLIRFSSVALLIAAGPALLSQQSMGQITGDVRSDAGVPLAGVKILLSSPALFGPRSAVTNAQGEWRITGLPPGTYRVQANADGFFGAEAQGVRLGLGAALTQSLTLNPISNARVVEVVAEAAAADKSDTKTSVNFSNENLEAIAFDRGFDGAANLTPGVTFGTNGQVAVRGGTTQDTAFRLNGTDIQDDIQGSVVGTYYIEDNIEDIQVMLSPLNARYGRNLGGAVNAVTKTGGNTFAGSLRSTFSKPKWNARNPFARAQDLNQEGFNREWQVTASGPIVKDRLWFSLGTTLAPEGAEDGTWFDPGFSPVIQRTGNANIDNATAAGPAAFGFDQAYQVQMFGGPHSYTQKAKQKYFDVKLTGALNANHTVELSLMKNRLEIGNRGFYWSDLAILRPEQATTQVDQNSVLALGYRGVLSDSMFVDAGFNEKLWKMNPPQGDPRYGNVAQVILYGDVATGSKRYGVLGNAWTYGSAPKEERNNRRAWVNVNFFREFGESKHEFDTGVEYNESIRAQGSQFGTMNRVIRVGGAYQKGSANDFLFPTIVWPGYGRLGQSPNGALGLAPIMRIYYGQDGTHRNKTFSGYFNDNFTLNNHWQFMGGLRLDRQQVLDTDGRELASPMELSPRFQVRFDLGGDNQRLFTFTAARFNGDFTAGFSNAFVQSARSVYTGYGWSGNGLQPAPGTANDLVAGSQAYGVRFVTFEELNNPANYTTPTSQGLSTAFQAWDNSRVYQIADDLKAPSMDETTLAYRHNLEGSDFLRLAYVHRRWNRNWAFKTDWARDEMVTIPDPAGKLADQRTPRIYVFNSDDLFRQYNGLEVEFKRTLSKIWSLSGSYTYSRLVGNTEAGQQGGSTFRDNGVEGYYNQRRALLKMGKTDQDFAPTGPLVNDQSNRGRLTLLMDLPIGKGWIKSSWTLQYDAGNPWSATSAAPLVISDPWQVGDSAKPNSHTQYYGGRGAYNTNDSYVVNWKLSFEAPLYLGVRLFGSLGVGNLFNHVVQEDYFRTIWPEPGGDVSLWLDATRFGQANPDIANYWSAGRNFGVNLGLRF